MAPIWNGRVGSLLIIDATSIAFCHNLSIRSHKVFRQVARRGKISAGWPYGFKVQRVINDCGELLAIPANGRLKRP